MRGGMPPASLMPVRLLSLTAMLASVLAAISVMRLSGPESSRCTRVWRAPDSRIAVKYSCPEDRLPMTAAARSVMICSA